MFSPVVLRDAGGGHGWSARRDSPSSACRPSVLAVLEHIPRRGVAQSVGPGASRGDADAMRRAWRAAGLDPRTDAEAVRRVRFPLSLSGRSATGERAGPYTGYAGGGGWRSSRGAARRPSGRGGTGADWWLRPATGHRHSGPEESVRQAPSRSRPGRSAVPGGGSSVGRSYHGAGTAPWV